MFLEGREDEYGPDPQRQQAQEHRAVEGRFDDDILVVVARQEGGQAQEEQPLEECDVLRRHRESAVGEWNDAETGENAVEDREDVPCPGRKVERE